MANVPISGLPTHIQAEFDLDADLMAVVENDQTRKITIAELRENLARIAFVDKFGQGAGGNALNKTPRHRYTIPAGFTAGSLFQIWTMFGGAGPATDELRAYIDIIPTSNAAGDYTDAENVMDITYTADKTLSRVSFFNLTDNPNVAFALPADNPDTLGLINGKFEAVFSGVIDMTADFDVVFSTEGSENGAGIVAAHHTLFYAFTTGYKA